MKFDAVLIAGPTASGKTQAALALAEALGGIIVNTDSMQVYREAPILTAQPSAAEMARVPHLLYGHVSARDAYSVGRYQIDAIQALTEAQAAKRIPIFTGGTGLYFAALTEGLAAVPAIPAPIRTAARARFDEIGAEAFYADLAARDPETAALLRPLDRQRNLRAYEVFEATGRPLAHWRKEGGAPVLKGLRLAKFVLDVPRPILREHIAARFEAMLAAGAAREANALKGIDPALPAAKILGLRELWAFADGSIGRTEMSERAITATRQFAKRQMTWFQHRMTGWTWVEVNEQSNFITKILNQLA